MPKIQTVDDLLASIQASQASLVKAMRETPSRVCQQHLLLGNANQRLAIAVAVIQEQIALSEDFEG